MHRTPADGLEHGQSSGGGEQGTRGHTLGVATFQRLMGPSTGPVLQGRVTPALPAA